MGLRRTLHSAKAKGFLSTTALRKIVTKDTVLSWCDSDKASAEYKLRNCLPGMIVPSSIKLFAVLVYANLANYILAFITHEDDPINDDIFPASNETRLFFNRGDERQLFLRTQWEIAPLFHTHVHLEPPKDIQIGKLFIRMNDKSLANSGIALIHEIKIEPGHLEGTSPNMIFAQKTIEEIEDHRESTIPILLREINTLQARKHPNILPISFSFTDHQSSTKRSASGKVLNIISPLFPMDMENWMMKKPSWITLQAGANMTHRDYFYDSVLQILKGVAYLHRRIDGRTTAHHDLKPKNIFVEDGNMVIGDLGKSKLIPTLDSSAVSSGRPLGTIEYTPPENFEENGEVKKNQRHGRAFDMWSMGCIMIEVAILIIHGWKSPSAISEFKNARSHLPDDQRPFQYARKDERVRASFYNSIPAVEQCLTDLQKHKLSEDESIKFKKYVQITINMLRSNPEQRIYSWEAVLDFYDLLHPHASASDRSLEADSMIERPRENQSELSDTPLHRAAERGDAVRVVKLIEKGWRADIKNCEGKTPIDLAKRGFVDVVSYLEKSLASNALQSPKAPCDYHVHSVEQNGRGFRSYTSRPTWVVLEPRIWAWPQKCEMSLRYDIDKFIPVCAIDLLECWMQDKVSTSLYFYGTEPKEWLLPTSALLAHKMEENGFPVMFFDISSLELDDVGHFLMRFAHSLRGCTHYLDAEMPPAITGNVTAQLNWIHETVSQKVRPKSPVPVIFTWWKPSSEPVQREFLDFVIAFLKILFNYSHEGIFNVFIATGAHEFSTISTCSVVAEKQYNVSEWSGIRRQWKRFGEFQNFPQSNGSVWNTLSRRLGGA